MKTLIALTVAAAMAAGLSIANAQMTPSGSSNNLTANGSKYCAQVKGTNSLNCKFATMAACENESKASGDACIVNPKGGTTGSR